MSQMRMYRPRYAFEVAGDSSALAGTDDLEVVETFFPAHRADRHNPNRSSPGLGYFAADRAEVYYDRYWRDEDGWDLLDQHEPRHLEEL